MQHRKDEKIVTEEEDGIPHLVAMPIKDKDSSESGRLCRIVKKPAFILNSMLQQNPGVQCTSRRCIRQRLLSQTCPGLKLSKGQLFGHHSPCHPVAANLDVLMIKVTQQTPQFKCVVLIM